MRYPRNCRLLKRSDFDAVFKSVMRPELGQLIRQRDYLVYQRFSEQVPRLGLSISKKAVRLAARRNRLKRCLRDFFRQHMVELSGDIIVRWTADPKSYEYDDLTKPLSLLIQKSTG